MSASFCQTETQPQFSGNHVHRGDYRAEAREMVENLGGMALTRAIDRQFEARLVEDDQGMWFWGRVCGAIVLIRTTEAMADAA